MKKTNIFMMLAVFLAAIGFTACDMSPEYQNAIPAEPVAVVKANMKALLDKSEVLKDNQVQGVLKSGINEMPENSRELLRTMLSDPEKCGLNLEHPAFVVLENLEQERGFLLFSVKDYEQVVTFVSSLKDESVSLSEQNGYKVLKAGSDNIAAFDDCKFVVAYARGTADATEYMAENEDAEEKSDELKTFLADDDDMAMYVDYKDIMRLAGNVAYPGIADIDEEMLKGAKLVCKLNFLAGKAVANMKIVGNDKIKEMYSESMASPESSLLKYLPQNCMALMQFGVKNIGKTIKANTPESQKTNLDEIVDNINVQLSEKGVQEKFTWDILDNLDGGMVLGVGRVGKGADGSILQAVALAECKDKSLFTLFVNAMNANGMGLKSVAADVYSLSWGPRMTYFIGYIDDKIFIAPDNIYNEIYSDKSLKPLKTNLSGSQIDSFMDGKSGMALSFDDITAIMTEFGLAESYKYKGIVDLLKKFNMAGYTVKAGNEIDFVLEFKNSEANALKQLKDIAVANAISEGSKM